MTQQKFSKLGLIHPSSIGHRGIDERMASVLAGMANFGLAKSTHDTYSVIRNHLGRCHDETGYDMELPFDTDKMLVLVGWMIHRGLKSSTMSTYISGLRMYHISLGYNEPVLREPIVKLILKGKENWDMVQKKMNGAVGRLAVTILVMKLIKKTLRRLEVTITERLMLWAVCRVVFISSRLRSKPTYQLNF